MIPASAESDVAEFGISIDGGASDWFSEEAAGFWCTFNGTGFETTVMSDSEVSVDGPTSMVSLAGKPSGAAVAESVVPALLPGAEPTPDEVSAGATAVGGLTCAGSFPPVTCGGFAGVPVSTAGARR